MHAMSYMYLFTSMYTCVHTYIHTWTCIANKAKVLYGMPRDPDVAAALAELEEEADAAMDDEKPKVELVNKSILLIGKYGSTSYIGMDPKKNGGQ